MNRNIILTRQVEIQGWNVIGQIAKPQKRQELGPVLMRAQETNGTDARDIVENLLFGSSRTVVARRLLQIGVSLGLLKEANNKFTLTDRGEKAIQTGEVFVPERGTWTLWISEDQLLPSPIVRVDDFKDEDAHAEFTIAGRIIDHSKTYRTTFVMSKANKQHHPPPVTVSKYILSSWRKK